ncbi:hypothetical protein BRE01_56820 [Brevibacillus reuszeri]|uniref:Copper resistance protein D domain-containing protein n=1 Tax=Brevibacillus reuszeri TaxID=54915 RepID=A0A0K9Z1K9_9BACL|nr:hypothetical protein [Brevibacillus reuszeri]KNB74831.1 hypothetical protein ADS79_00460 [Brevibacillus reuszeri]MED1859520.1 hypothetical protein [Brevibacillus reuszeri]GED71980.1 hypothetical protein BRE01_56820 [Brevibacillus reuszeri]
MYAGMYFTHIIGLAVWFGALVVVLLLLRTYKAYTDQGQVATALANKTVWSTLQVAAFAVLLSGIGMIIQAGLLGQKKPLWLKLMEEGGGLIILLFIIFVTLWTRKLRNALKQGDATRYTQISKRFFGLSLAFVVAIAAVVLVVSLRLA